MKKLLVAVVSLILFVCILTSTSITVFADNKNGSSESSFPYDNASIYVADCIIKGIVTKDGTTTSTPYISMGILHKYTYQNLAEALIDDPLLSFNSTFWKNLGIALDGDFVKLANWQKDMYVVLIMDYLNYSENDDVYASNLEKKTIEFGQEILTNAFDYADSEYLKNVDDIIKNQSLTDAINFSDKYGYINEINEYSSLVGDIADVSESAIEYYENLSKALAVKSADESRLKFLEKMKEAGKDNKYFVEAVDEVINAYKSTFSEIAYSEGYSTMSGFAVKECFNILEDSIPELKLILEGLNVYASGLDWLFNSDDISDNNLKLLLLYTMGSYTLTALNSLSDTYKSNPTKENAESLIGGYLAFLKYREYATSNTYGFVSSTLFDGISNKIKNIFSNENQAKYEDFKNYLDYDISFSQSIEKMVDKFYNIYFNIVEFDVDVFDESISANSENQNNNYTNNNINYSPAERDIVLVLDTSGSMSGTPLDETKKASTNFVDTILEEDASIGVVNYDSDADMKSDFSNSKNSLDSVINDLGTGGGTDIESGLRAADQMLNQSSAEKKIIVLMSDGEPNDGLVGDELIAYADELKEKGIYIYTLGFFKSVGEKSAPQALMEKIASDGCHYEVSDADSLVFFFGDIADQINGQKYIYVRIACPVDVSVTYNGETLDSSGTGLNTRTSFGTLTFEESDTQDDTNSYSQQTDSEESSDDRVKILRLKEGEDYDIEIEGTGRGRMNYSIGFMDENGEYSDFRKFNNIKITRTTQIDTVANVSDNTVLNVDEDGDGKYDLVYKAEANGYGEIVDYSYILYIVIGAVSAIALLVLVLVIRSKIKKRKLSKSK